MASPQTGNSIQEDANNIREAVGTAVAKTYLEGLRSLTMVSMVELNID